MDIHEIKVGVPGTTIPPFDDVVKNAKRAEELGYDSIWWPDHLMGWIPESIWTPDMTPLVIRMRSPHVFLDPLATMAAVAVHTSKVLLGTSVTECFRRHPPTLAQEILTLDHISKGRVILGIGAGELENVEPYGIPYYKPASRLEEAIKVIRILWSSKGKKVSFDGKFWKLRDAVFDLEPYQEGRYPPIWIGAHGKRTLEITGRLADGWLPACLPVEEYGEMLKVVRDSAKRAGRDPNEITPGLYVYVIIGREHEECHKLFKAPLIRAWTLTAPSWLYEKCGFEHPFGKGFNPVTQYVPARYTHEEIIQALEKVPEEVCEHFFLHGTPDEVIKKIEEYGKAGLQHIVLWNLTYFGDATKIGESFKCMAEVLKYIKGK